MNFDSEKEEIIKKIEQLKNAKILIIGDFALDEMVYGNTERISREAPVLILEHYNTEKILGAASNAANNVSTLNMGKAAAIGVFGDDYQGSELIKILKEKNINTDYMVQDKNRKTTTKTRISGSCNHSITQQIVRIDRQTKTPLDKETQDKVIENIKRAIVDCDGIILSDYHLGFLSEKIVNCVIEQANIHGKIVVADIQKNMEKYKGADTITPNQPDSEKQVGFFIKNDEDLIKAGTKLLDELNLKRVLLTRGENGMALFEKKDNEVKFEKIPAYNKKEVFDVTGAGDTVVAAYTLALCSGLGALDAMKIGNLAASIVIRYFGCHTVTIEDLKNEILKQ